MKKSDYRSLADALAVAAGLGIETAVIIAVGVGLGRGIDCLFGVQPIGTVLGTFAGVGCAMRSAYLRVMRLDRR